MRTYTVLINECGKFSNWPGGVFYSPLRIREFTLGFFMGTFNRVPTFHWHKDGFMAEARIIADSALESVGITVEQVQNTECQRETWTMVDGLPHPYVGPSRQLKEAA